MGRTKCRNMSPYGKFRWKYNTRCLQFTGKKGNQSLANWLHSHAVIQNNTQVSSYQHVSVFNDLTIQMHMYLCRYQRQCIVSSQTPNNPIIGILKSMNARYPNQKRLFFEYLKSKKYTIDCKQRFRNHNASLFVKKKPPKVEMKSAKPIKIPFKFCLLI